MAPKRLSQYQQKQLVNEKKSLLYKKKKEGGDF